MLPAHRVIGHKEYGNTGHPGRKKDPEYDMNWRRNRVAAFTPRGDDMPTSQEVADAVEARLRNAVWGTETVEHLLWQAATAERNTLALSRQITGQQATIDGLVKLVAVQNGLSLDEVRKVVAGEVDRAKAELIEGLDVELNVKPAVGS